MTALQAKQEYDNLKSRYNGYMKNVIKLPITNKEAKDTFLTEREKLAIKELYDFLYILPKKTYIVRHWAVKEKLNKLFFKFWGRI